MYLRRMIVALALTGSVASCSRETTGPADISNDGGLGNKTLFVEATVDVDWDSEAASFVSRFRVIVLDGNDREVREADVTISGGFGSQPRCIPTGIQHIGGAGRPTPRAARQPGMMLRATRPP